VAVGLVLTGIHLVICVPLIVWEEASRWHWVRSQENLPPLELARPVPPPPPDAVKPAEEGENCFVQPFRLAASHSMAGANYCLR
jgi:hypothetical protein